MIIDVVTLFPSMFQGVAGESILKKAQEKGQVLWRPFADEVVEPNVNGFKYDDFEQTCALVAAGEKVMREALPRVKKWLEPEPVVVKDPRPSAGKLGIPSTQPAVGD